MLIYKDLDIKEADNYYYNACKENDIESVKYLVQNYKDLNLTQDFNRGIRESAIDVLCKLNHKEIIQYLLEVEGRKEIFVTESGQQLHFSFSLWNIGKYNHLDLLKYVFNFFKNELSTKSLKDGLRTLLNGASAGGHIEIVDYLLLSEELKVKPNLADRNYFAFQLATENGHIELVKYYLLNKKLKCRPTVSNYKNHAIRYASWKNHFDLVEYLLTSKELSEHADIHAAGESVLEAAIGNENIPMIEFLLKSEKLKDHADLHHKNDLPFRNAVKNNNMLSLQYLICDYEIEQSPEIKKSISKRKDIQKMFEMRGLYKKLSTTLLPKENKVKKEKI